MGDRNCYNCICSGTEVETGYLRCFNKWAYEFGEYVQPCNLCDKFEESKEVEVDIKVVEDGE